MGTSWGVEGSDDNLWELGREINENLYDFHGNFRGNLKSLMRTSGNLCESLMGTRETSWVPWGLCGNFAGTS